MTTLIVGGGLSGLALADALHAKGRDFVLVEARARLGGRIKTDTYAGGAFDLGPAWFWPGQPRIACLIERLKLAKFDQFADGDLMYENERGHVQRGRGFSSMQGSWRLAGGLGASIDALADGLPQDRIRMGTEVTELKKTEAGIVATFRTGEFAVFDRVVLCLPPRVATNIKFLPGLPSVATRALEKTPTWMAGQAKAVAIYDTPFWRNAGLSGDAQSRFGPMVEIHDASPEHGGPYALFGFIGVPPKVRTDVQMLRQNIQVQLGRLFGPFGAKPRHLFVKDWAFDPFTATEADLAPLHAHPSYGMPRSLVGLWDDQLLFCGTEMAPQFGGYIEGALESAENALRTLDIKMGGQNSDC
ncbi:MAG: NAD(P)/FAD-dependent oxidoreductase [Pacificibacter sp.]|uniref:flavin monoamine oxidase family protein n=1 Tax=Pacificibacter sp. TaxID=1917866 RepID=UPI00321BCC58